MSNFSQEQLTDLLEVEGINADGFGSIAKIPMRDRRLTAEAKAIYAYIASFAGAGRSAFPSVGLMCYELDMSESRYYRHRKLLIECGYIRVKPVTNAGKFGKNLYTIVMNPVSTVPSKQVDGSPSTQNECTENACTENKGTIIKRSKSNRFKSSTEQQQQHTPSKHKRHYIGFEAVIQHYLGNKWSRVHDTALEVAKKHKHTDASLGAVLDSIVSVTLADHSRSEQLLLEMLVDRYGKTKEPLGME